MKPRLTALAGIAGVVAAIGLAAPVAAAPSDADNTWMVAAHQSNLAEIAAGNAALQQATTDTVRQLGQMFIAMHTELDAQLTQAATQSA